MFRIISGKWKSKKILAPPNIEVRPTTDFAKEALFSILENRYDLEFCSVLDLFAGIGSIALEFASRGCQDVTVVEQNIKQTTFIHNTAANLDMGMQINIQRANVFDWLKKNRNQKTYDIIFADPPFDLEAPKYQELIDLVLNQNFLKENGIFVLEHASKNKIANPNIFETRKYGNVSFSFIKPLTPDQ